MDTKLNKNVNDFCLKPLMKFEIHISLVHLHLLSTKKIILLNFYLSVSKLRVCFVSPHWLIKLFVFFFFCSQTQPLKSSFLFLPAWPGPARLKKSPLMCCPGVLEKSPLMCRPGPTQPVGKMTSHLSGRVRARPEPVQTSALCPACPFIKFHSLVAP